MTDDQRQWAINRIRVKQAFWLHLTVYLLVNALLVFIWWVTSGDYFWPMWPMLGWGIAVAAHAVGAFAGTSQISEERIAREIEGGTPVGR